MNVFNSLVVGSPKKARVEIVPLIDVVFFLLATFVLFVLSLEKMGCYDLPSPHTDHDEALDQTVYIEASTPEVCFWREGRTSAPEAILRSELAARLAEYRGRRGAAAKVFVNGDNAASFGQAIRIIDDVRRAKIPDVAIETVAAPGKRGG
jgi:biopolymer transport protein ExbD